VAGAQHDPASQKYQRRATGTGGYFAFRLPTVFGDQKQLKTEFNLESEPLFCGMQESSLLGTVGRADRLRETGLLPGRKHTQFFHPAPKGGTADAEELCRFALPARASRSAVRILSSGVAR